MLGESTGKCFHLMTSSWNKNTARYLWIFGIWSEPLCINWDYSRGLKGPDRIYRWFAMQSRRQDLARDQGSMLLEPCPVFGEQWVSSRSPILILYLYPPATQFRVEWACFTSLQWCHIERNGVSNHRLLDCLLNRLCRRRSKKISNLRVTGLF